MVSPPPNSHWHTLKIKILACRSPSKDALIPHFWHVVSHIPRESLGWDQRSPLRAKQDQNTTVLSIHREGRVGGESIQQSLVQYFC